MSRQSIRFGRPNRKARVSQEPVELTIEGLSHEGRGIARHQGKTFFVAGALPGETVVARVEKAHKKFDEARVTEVIEASPHRREPFCAHYGQCGGCDLQHLAHEEQIRQKQQQVLGQLKRLGGIEPEAVESPLISPAQQYRRSARIGINELMRNGETLVGFRRRGSNKLLNINDCPVLDTRARGIFNLLRDTLDELGCGKTVTHAELAFGDHNGALTLRTKPALKADARALLSDKAASLNLQLFLQTEGDREYAGGTAQAPLSYTLAEQQLSFEFAPGDFIQVNAALNQQMVSRALEWLAPKADERVLDLFCGLGNFTLPLAQQAQEVVGVEGNDAMTSRARANAERNGLTNTTFFRNDLSQDFRHQPWYRQGFDKILLDPPRTGALEAVNLFAEYGARSILYVSCNPAALARDGAELIKAGYRLSRFCVMDMFPHTQHVESLALFEKADA